MTLDEARKKLGNIDDFCKSACSVCTANDWYCPTECDTLRKARRMNFDRIIKSYARNDGDLSKVFRFIKEAKINLKKGK